MSAPRTKVWVFAHISFDATAKDIGPPSIYDTKESALRALRDAVLGFIDDDKSATFAMLEVASTEDLITWLQEEGEQSVIFQELDIWTWDDRGTRTLELDSNVP